MKASKELSSRLCPLGDVSPLAARWGVSGVASWVSDPARVSGGSRGGAPPGVLASARSARFARGAAPAQSVAEGWWRPSSHSVSGVAPSGSVSGWSAANASPPPCAAMFGGSALGIDGRSAPPPGSPIGVGVGVRCGGPRISSAPTVGSPRCGWVGSAGGSASSFVGCVAPRAWPSATGGGSGRFSGPAGCGALAGAAVRAGSGPGPGLAAGRLGDEGSAGRAVSPVGGAWCRWGAGPSCVVAGRSSAPDVAGAWGIRPPLGPGVWGCTVSEGRAAVVSVGVAVCACVGGPSGGTYAGPAAGWSGVPWCGWACVAVVWLAAGRGPCADATGGVTGCGLPVGLGAGSLCGCAVLGGCSGWVPTAPVFVGFGMAPLPAGDARCPRIPVAVWCCVGCRCAARLGARSCQGLRCMPALNGARSPVVRVASVARCWCGVATGVGGAEVDGLGDVEDVAADVQACTFVALVALVAQDRGGRVVMVAVLRDE